MAGMDDNTVILENTLKYLRFQNIWPKSNDELYSRKMFYIKFILVTLSTSILLWGSLMHMITAIYGKTGAQIDTDMSMIVSIMGTYYFNFSYLVNVEKIAEVLNDLSNFEIFGKPPGIVDFNRKLNRLAKWHQIYICGGIVSLCSAQILEIKACKANNVEKGIHDVCGLATNIWFPFDVDFFPLKQIIYLLQLYSAYFSFATSSTISFSIMESTEHVIYRIMHVKDLFIEALNEESQTLRRSLLKRCIGYHNFVIRAAESLSESYGTCIFVHVLLTGAILACNGCQLLQGVHLNSIALFTGWFMSLLMVGFVGQRLTDECFILRDAIYGTKWYDLDVETQKDLLFVLLRCKKPLYLKAGAFGFMSLVIVLSILKTAYTVVSVMKGTS
nr:odorant receptor [Semanotus bifasciatus]